MTAFIPKYLRFLTFLMVFVCVQPIVAGRPKVGLVLGGGGAKGAAEVGVLKVIEEAGIPIDYVAGTSIGAIVGGLYATGYTAAELDSIFRQQDWIPLLTDRREDLMQVPYREIDGIVYLFGFPVYDINRESHGRIGALKGNRVETLIDSLMGVRGMNEFSLLKRPFSCVACDLRTGSEVILDDGIPAQAMRASMAIPGVFKPVRRDSLLLLDGGMTNNLPVDLVRRMGADIVIAIDLQQNEVEVHKKRDLSLLHLVADPLGIGGLVRWAGERPDIDKYLDNRQHCDLYLHPRLDGYDVTSFGTASVAHMLQLGEEEGRRHWDDLLRLKALIDNE